MGAWGEGPFDNDIAADWVDEFDGADRDTGLEAVHTALQAAANTGGDDYLDSDVGVEAVAAAELVAAIRGIEVKVSSYNEGALAWVATTKPTVDDQTVSLAVAALERVAAPESELAEVWAEIGADPWREAVERRLASLRSLRRQ